MCGLDLHYRLERLDHLAQKFRHKCEIHEEWAAGKEDMLQSGDFKRCRLNELKVKTKSKDKKNKNCIKN